MKKEHKIAEEIIKKILSIEGKHVHAVLVGSLARNTHLRADRDLDIFVLFPEHLKREEFEKEGLRIGKMVFRGREWEEAYSEHPYVRGNYKGFEVEIVPSYSIKSTEFLKSSVDRSVFHNSYLKKKLLQKQLDEVRLLRQFLKGIGSYGADIKTSSVPGYVAELLILNYGSFEKTINAVSTWEKGEVIDVEKHLTEQEAKKRFHIAPLIVIDPTDATRNVAAALSLNQFSRFIAAARAFKKKPSRAFFFGKKEKAWSRQKTASALEKKEIIAVSLAYPKKIIPDIMWGQLKKLRQQMQQELERNGFKAVEGKEWTDEKKTMAVVFELEALELSHAMKRVGPEVSDFESSMRFLSKHKNPVSGPKIENGRWVIEVKREFPHASILLKTFLAKAKRQGKKSIRVAAKSAKILAGKKILQLFASNKEFQLFLTKFLKGEEDFLAY